MEYRVFLKVWVKIHYMCVCVKVKKKKRKEKKEEEGIFKVFVNLKTNENQMVNN